MIMYIFANLKTYDVKLFSINYVIKLHRIDLQHAYYCA